MSMDDRRAGEIDTPPPGCVDSARDIDVLWIHEEPFVEEPHFPVKSLSVNLSLRRSVHAFGRNRRAKRSNGVGTSLQLYCNEPSEFTVFGMSSPTSGFRSMNVSMASSVPGPKEMSGFTIA